MIDGRLCFVNFNSELYDVFGCNSKLEMNIFFTVFISLNLLTTDFLIYFLSEDAVMYTADDRNIHSVDEV